MPEGEGQDDAYVLFYQRSGLSFKVTIPSQVDEDGRQAEERPGDKERMEAVDEAVTLAEDLG